jgi:hypothetical protein
MMQYLLALYMADDEKRSAEQTRQVWADVNATPRTCYAASAATRKPWPPTPLRAPSPQTRSNRHSSTRGAPRSAHQIPHNE